MHYLRANERDWSPPAVIFLDTETRTVQSEPVEILGLRLWAATFVDRKVPKRTTERHESGWGRTANDLALWIGNVTRNRETVWLYAHNLGFDLTTTRLPLWLVRHGWSITEASVGGKSPWLRMKRGAKVLTIVDSWGWLPVALERIGQAVTVPKLPLPSEDDSEAAWLARCGWDVDILARAVLELMQWWDDNKLGNWTISGAGCGWNAYRHKPTTTPVVIDPDPAKVAQDRLYVHGGRRGTWIIGDHRAGPFLELDFTNAYPQVAAQLPHPIGRAAPFDSLPLDDAVLDSERWGITARVKIRTSEARWPVRIDGASWYPVGEFWADLAGPDIVEARRIGALVEIGKGETHRLGRNMATWAQWVIAVQRGEIPGMPAVAQIAAKTWGRSVIGKWAARSFEKTKLGTAPTIAWGYEESWNHAKQCAAGMVDLAGQRWFVSASGDPDNAYPAVLAWVESEVRVRLGRVIAALGEGAILQCDTDGLIVAQRVLGTRASKGHLIAPTGLSGQARVAWVLNCLHPITAPLDLRIKNRLGHVHVLGPQHVTADGQRRFAGMSKGALLGEDGRYHAKLWPSLQWQLANGSAAGYVRPDVVSVIKGPYPTGWILADKSVVPVETVINAQGETCILPWHLTQYAKNGKHRADIQHQTLERFI